MIKLLLSAVFISSVYFSTSSCADIYFNAKVVGPVTNIFSIDEQGLVNKLTPNKSWRDTSFSVSPSGDIAFSSNRRAELKFEIERKPENYNIFIQKKNDTLTQLTFGPEREFSPQYNAQGSKLGYLKISTAKTTELHVVDLKSKKDTIIASAPYIYDFNWAPNGKKIAYSQANKSSAEITIINIKTNKTETLFSNKLHTKTADGSSQNTNTKNSDGTKSPIKNVYLQSPIWSPNGKHIAFVTHPLAREQNKVLYVINTKNKKITSISDKAHQAQTPVNWSKDSKSLLYSALVGYEFYYDEALRDRVHKGAMHIYQSTLNGTKTQLTQGDHYHGRPVFSPDNNRIAYLYSEKLGDARTLKLRTIKTDGSQIKEIYPSVERESQLYWF